jgi:hypothetical protein
MAASDLKRSQLRSLGYADQRMSDYEDDHLIPLELGGAPADPQNLWPEPRVVVDGWNSDQKDDLEGKLQRMVCAEQLPLVDAQRAIAKDWTAAYRRFRLRD